MKHRENDGILNELGPFNNKAYASSIKYIKRTHYIDYNHSLFIYSHETKECCNFN